MLSLFETTGLTDDGFWQVMESHWGAVCLQLKQRGVSEEQPVISEEPERTSCESKGTGQHFSALSY